MEVEAKFALPDRETFGRLETVERLAGFTLSAGQTEQVRDTYLDTADRLLLAAGYACRQRERGERVLVTVKGLGKATGAIHRREELEVVLPTGQPPAAWPASPARERVLELTGGVPLEPLFTLEQTRVKRALAQPLADGERPVAELSLDEVRLHTGEEETVSFEVEVELAPQGSEDDLAALVACLRDEWGLLPEPRSKFERALALFSLLTPQERTACRRLAERDDLYGRRARAMLALDEGAAPVQAGARAGMSARRVRHWRAAFRQRRLAIFPPRVLEQAAVPDPEPRAERKPKAEPLPLAVLFERYQVDMAHARAVADHALALFDHLAPFHGLPPQRRSLLETAALLHNVGLRSDPERHHAAGRDILLAHPPTELDEQEHRIVATTTFLHRKRITRRRLDRLAKTALAGLPAPVQAETLALAALVRLADGLDYAQSGSSRLGEVRRREGLVEFEVTGPCAEVDAGRAREKGDLWQLLFGVALEFSIAGAPGAEPPLHLPLREQETGPAVAALPERPGLQADDSMAEAARKTLYFHFRRMLYHEPGTRLGEDIEALHDMRVATRRLRAAIPVFSDHLDMEQIRPFAKRLRRTGRLLGAVRDLDVFWEKTQHYLDGLPAERQGELEPLQKVWAAERERARQEMLAYLDGEPYARFKEQFDAFLQTPGAGARPLFSASGEPRPHRLRHVVPVVIYQRLAVVQAYGEWVTRPDAPLERLHQLRIASKGLRYALEFFEEVLGPEAKTLIEQIKALQDHLGNVQDAVVASKALRDFLTWGTWGHVQPAGKRLALPSEPVIAPGVAAYMAARQVELQELLDGFPRLWAGFQEPRFGQSVAAALRAL